MPAPPVLFQRLTTAEGPAFEALLEIYTEAIPERERKSRAQIGALVLREDYFVMVMTEQGQVIGFSLLFLPRGKAFLLLEYMAVAAEHRSRGLGAHLFQQSLAAAGAVAGWTWCLVEVDSPREASPDQCLRTRREQFYRRLGCRRVEGLAYLLPLPGAGAMPAMDLLVLHSGAEGGPVAVPRAEVADWLDCLYVQVYGCPARDPRLSAMMQSLGDPVPLT